MRKVCIELLAPQVGERILDLGCGTAYYLSQMPELEYHGFDIDERYIKHARARFGSRGNFYCQQFREDQAQRLGQFDGVMLLGILHHLDDDACNHLLNLTASVLAPEGRVIALDTVVHDGQNKFEHFLARSDRGKYVRRPAEFMSLANKAFGSVDCGVEKSRWIPSIVCYMILGKPTVSRFTQTIKPLEQ
jgi:2-polyprenyl-3-methyl-5-hydroxy-6-metoxy-1,4-benzoquinol methylase